MNLFYDEEFIEILQSYILDLLNNHVDFLSDNTVSSTRAVGDAIQNILSTNCDNIFDNSICKSYISKFGKKAMADFEITDYDGLKYIIDVKTHCESTKFNMPNLTSVKSLANLYKKDNNNFIVFMIKYTINNKHVEVSKVIVTPIEHIDWKCLTIGNLGNGQIQITNSNRIIIDTSISRKSWMNTLCDTLLTFYPLEIVKIKNRIKEFEEIKDSWR